MELKRLMDLDHNAMEYFVERVFEDGLSNVREIITSRWRQKK